MKILKQLRMENKLTLRNVQDLTGISNAYLSQLENGKIKKPSADVLSKLSKCYFVNINRILDLGDTGKSKTVTLEERLKNIEERINKIERYLY